MVSDTEPRYRLVDSNGNVVGSLYAEADGTLKLQEATSGSDNEVSIATDGTFSAPAVSTEQAAIGRRFEMAESQDQISNGRLDISAPYHSLEGEDRNPDNLDHIDGGDTAGEIIILRAASEEITVRHGQGGDGQINLDGGTDKVLTGSLDRLMLQYQGFTDEWCQLAFSKP